MRRTIEANVRYDEYNKIEYRRKFEIMDVDMIPEFDEVKEAKIDICQPRTENAEYLYFVGIEIDEDGDENKTYFAIRKDYEKEITFKSYKTNTDVFVTIKNFITGEDETITFSFDYDGILFEDANEAEDYIIKEIIEEIESEVDICEDNYYEIIGNFLNILDERIS